MDTIFIVLLLAIVQGITEYLPVSSSGHLVILQHLFGITEPEILFDLVLHAGTLSALIVYYRKFILILITDAINSIMMILRSNESLTGLYKKNDNFRFIVLIIIGNIPTAFIGLFFKEEFQSLFRSTDAVGVALLFTGTILFATRFINSDNNHQNLTIPIALLIGVAQGFAIVPGISRAGITICIALFMKVNRELSARFSFMLSVPAIIGALLIEFDTGTVSNNFTSIEYIVGFFVALLSGFAALLLLILLVKRDALFWFAFYCFAVAGIVLIT
ncbi:MAG: undecaprenyl-diphosphate phosphatase [Nitrospinota bacterium]